MQSETAYFFVEIGHIPVIEKRVLNAGHRLHESWPVDKGKPFHSCISVLSFGKRGIMNFLK